MRGLGLSVSALAILLAASDFESWGGGNVAVSLYRWTYLVVWPSAGVYA